MKDALGRPQSALVVGATSEIAGAILTRLVRERTKRLVLAGRDAAALDSLAQRMKAFGAEEVRTLAFEAEDLPSHGPLVKEAFSGADLDLVLIAFGVLGDQEADEHDPAAAGRVMQVNCTASVTIGTACAEALLAQGHGHLVALSSVAGERIRRSNYVYGASKAGMDAFFQGLAAALGPKGIDVTIVRPGFVRTRMTEGMKEAPLSTDADQVAAAVVTAVAERTPMVWVPPALRYVMAGLRHLPTPVFRRLPL